MIVRVEPARPRTTRTVTLRSGGHRHGHRHPGRPARALFAPFVQVDGSTTRKYGGTGLGLAICQATGRTHGRPASAWKASRARARRSGSPSSWKNGPTGRLPADAPLADLGGVNVLVVDDHPANRLLVTTLLASWGCRFAEAESGEPRCATAAKPPAAATRSRSR